MRCINCKYGELNKHDVLICHKRIGNQGIICLLRNTLRTSINVFYLTETNQKKALEMSREIIDKLNEETDEGEDWKGDRH